MRTIKECTQIPGSRDVTNLVWGIREGFLQEVLAGWPSFPRPEAGPLTQSQRLVTTSTFGHDLPKLLLVLIQDSYSEGIHPSYASSPTPNLGCSIPVQSKESRRIGSCLPFTTKWTQWPARRINALNPNISGMEWLHYKLIVSYLNNIRILPFPLRAHSCNISELLCRLLSEF